ncbi:MAG TPA: T9SS type A sorting domain-containing protein, partial [Candidatus Marinimicrobia bacterium]|nr:T9SS type A sorting domain-containing protein [Candidatus Neomarinimicrobiota bacterium]
NPYTEGTNPEWPDQKGYVAGTNVYEDIGKYQRFEFYSSNYVVGAVLYFGIVDIDVSGVADTITVVLKGLSDIASDSTDGLYIYGPSDDNLATAKITLDQVDTTGVGTLVMFDNAVQMAGDDFMPDSFFIGIEWELTDHLDTFALFSDSTGAELGNGFNRAWEKFGDGSYNDFGCVLSPGYCWGYDIDMWIGAVHSSDVVAVDDYEILFPNQLVMHSAYPNPFNPSTTINYNIPYDSNVMITIKDIRGRVVSTLYNNYYYHGKGSKRWDGKDNSGSSLPTGIYMYNIQTDREIKTGKILLLK